MYRFSLVVQRFPIPALLVAGAILAVLAFPLAGAELGVSDAGVAPDSTTSRRAYDLQAEAFGPGFNGTLTVVVERRPALTAGLIARVQKAISSDAGVVSVSPARLSPDGTTAVFAAIPSTAPQSADTRELINRLRGETLPGLLSRTDSEASVFLTGPTAAFIDMSQRIEARLVPFFAVVVGLSMVLLAISFRSLTVPIKAAVLNFAAIAAALGMSVAVFQWGWGARLIGLDRTGPIESFMPMFVFAVLFGLSMDYEVFLVSRIRERFVETGDAREAIAFGVASSGRVISAAAAILVVVFASFILGDDRVIKEFGLTLSVAIFLDATIVRLIMVPAAMQLMGNASWALPRWLDDRLPRWDLEPPVPELKPEPSSQLAPEPVQS